MKRCYLISVFILLLSSQLFAQQFYQHPESRYRFPSSLGAFDRREIHRYPDQPLGVDITYGAYGLGVVDTYIFDYGLPSIPDGIESEAVRNAFLSSVWDIRELAKRGNYLDLKLTSEPGATWQVRPDTPRFHMATFEYRLNDANAEPLVSWLLVTGTRQHFLKIRLTCAASHAKEGASALERLLVEFFETNKE